LLVYNGHETMCRYLRANQLETGVIEYLRKTVRPGEWVADFGAHVGFYTCLLAVLVGSRGRVFAFEPETQHATACALNVARNRYGNVTVFAAAVGGTTAIVPFPVGFCGTGIPGVGELRCWQVRVGDVLGRLDGFKMDTQGSEANILGGFGGLLDAVRWGVIENHNDGDFDRVMAEHGLPRVGDVNNAQRFFERQNV